MVVSRNVGCFLRLIMYDIIVFENLLFCPPTRKREPALSKMFTLKRYLFGDGFNRIRVDRTPNYKYPDSCGRGVNNVYANYLHLITGEPITKEASSTRPTGHRLYDV